MTAADLDRVQSVRADGLSLDEALALARRDVEVVFGGRLSLDAPASNGWASTSPRMYGGLRAAEVLEGYLRGRGFEVLCLGLGGPDGWYLNVNLMACPEGASPEERSALAIRCARLEEIMQRRGGANAARARACAEREYVHCLGETIVSLRERVDSSQWVLDNHYGDGSEAGRADRRSMTEALAEHAASIARQEGRREMSPRDRYRFAPEIEGLAREAAREERRACEGLDLGCLRARASRAGLRAPEAPEIRAAAVLFLLAAARGFELAAAALPGAEHAAARGEFLRRATDVRASYAFAHGVPPAEARWMARARPRATAWLSASPAMESPAEHATIDGEHTACGLPVVALKRIPEDHGRTNCALCGEVLRCGGLP